MTLYRIGRFLFLLYFKCVNRATIVGKENFPEDKGVLICSNHISNFDPPLVGVAAPRKVRFMAKAEMFTIPILKRLFIVLGAFPVKRGLTDKQALRNGISILNNGEVMGLFPEGTRNRSKKLKQGLTGAGFFALRSNAVVIPCAIVGSYRPFKKINIAFGKPIDFQAMTDKRLSAKEATEMIMDHIEKLLAEKRNI